VAKIAIGIGMNVIASDRFIEEAEIELDFFDGQKASFKLVTKPLDELLKQSDFISLHVPAQKEYVIGKKQIEMMKEGAALINAARGGVLDEEALLEALENKKLAFAALDTFENEPKPAVKVLMNQKVSLSPHIGAATKEAQDRIGTELASQIQSLLG
jgi:D-3-phosphoglycerate dehydrogenase